MTIAKQIAKNLRDVHFGGNWTDVNMKGTLQDVTYSEALTKVQDFNSIATLTVHTTYYIDVVTKVLQGGPLDAKDAYSFILPKIESEADWQGVLEKAWQNAETCALLIEQLNDNQLLEIFSEEKYGNYFRNLMGMVEHMHYHLGQMVLIKKMIRSATA